MKTFLAIGNFPKPKQKHQKSTLRCFSFGIKKPLRGVVLFYWSAIFNAGLNTLNIAIGVIPKATLGLPNCSLSIVIV